MKKITALFLAVLMVFSLCACGSSAKGQSSSYAVAAPQADYAAYDKETEMPMAAEEAAYGGFAANAAAEPVETNGTPTEAPSAGDIAVDKIIYSASATIETTDFDETLKGLDALIASYGGFVESSSIGGNNYYSTSHGYASNRSADYRIRIPSRDFAAVMNSLSTLGNVPHSNTYTENITSQYYDVQARLSAYRTQEQSLLEMMEKAENVTELLEIQDYLTDVRYHIESLQSSLTNWDRQVSYSTISLSVEEVREYTPEAKLSFGQQLALALTRGLKGIGEFFRDLLLWLVEALPALLILGVVVFLVVLLIRRIRRGRAARRARKAAAQTQTPPQS
jgi:surface glycoprotein (TIGR04207 family)